MHELISLERDQLAKYSPTWIPFVQRIANRMREYQTDLIAEIMTGQTQIHLIFDGEKQEAVGLVGTRIFRRGEVLVGDIKWCTGNRDGHTWGDLLEDMEARFRLKGCTAMQASARPGWKRLLRGSGYRLTHVVFEKDF